MLNWNYLLYALECILYLNLNSTRCCGVAQMLRCWLTTTISYMHQINLNVNSNPDFDCMEQIAIVNTPLGPWIKPVPYLECWLLLHFIFGWQWWWWWPLSIWLLAWLPHQNQRRHQPTLINHNTIVFSLGFRWEWLWDSACQHILNFQAWIALLHWFLITQSHPPLYFKISSPRWDLGQGSNWSTTRFHRWDFHNIEDRLPGRSVSNGPTPMAWNLPPRRAN